MAQAPKKNSAVLIARSRKTAATPPMNIGAFPKLLTPDDYDPDKPMYKVNGHLNPACIEAMGTFLQVNCIDAHFDELAAMAKEAKLPCVGTKEECQSPKDWLEGKLKEPHEKSKVQLPVLQFGVKADITKRDGTVERRTMKFWDAGNRLLTSPEKLRMSSETIIQVIVHPNLMLSKQLGKDPRAQLQLVGIRILKYVPFGGGDQAPDTAEEEMLRKVMGNDFDADDHGLDAFVGGAAPEEAGAPEDDVDAAF